MRITKTVMALLFAGIVLGASYYVIARPSDLPPLINAQQLSSITNMNWDLSSTSKISKVMNISASEGGFNPGVQGNFKLEKNTSTTLSVNVIYFRNSTDANNTYINLTNSFFEGYSSHFPLNTTVSNGTVYDIMFQPENASNGTGSTINFTTLVAVHKYIFVEIMESGIFFSGSMAFSILNWELKASQ